MLHYTRHALKTKIVHTSTDCFQVKYHKVYSYNTYENSAMNGHLECEKYCFINLTIFLIIIHVSALSIELNLCLGVNICRKYNFS